MGKNDLPVKTADALRLTREEDRRALLALLGHARKLVVLRDCEGDPIGVLATENGGRSPIGAMSLNI